MTEKGMSGAGVEPYGAPYGSTPLPINTLLQTLPCIIEAQSILYHT